MENPFAVLAEEDEEEGEDETAPRTASSVLEKHEDVETTDELDGADDAHGDTWTPALAHRRHKKSAAGIDLR